MNLMFNIRKFIKKKDFEQKLCEKYTGKFLQGVCVCVRGNE